MDVEEWMEKADDLQDKELQDFRRTICLLGSHHGVAAVGSCKRCRGYTSSMSMQICKSCGEKLGVCPFDLFMVGWGDDSIGNAEALAINWLALWMRGFSYERKAAKRALPQFKIIKVVQAFQKMESAAKDLPVRQNRSPARAEMIIGFRGMLPESVVPGGSFLGGIVVRVNPKLRSCLVRTEDAVHLEDLAAFDSTLAFIELNSMY
ncbi:hypothetical protein L0222_16190 [bacterium]|nr:hypothetical protein [bacterium]